MPEPKTYLNCQAKEKTFEDGGSIINLSVKAQEVIAFAQAHANQGGYLNLVVATRRTPGKYGETHSVYLDTYQRRARPGRHDVVDRMDDLSDSREFDRDDW